MIGSGDIFSNFSNAGQAGKRSGANNDPAETVEDTAVTSQTAQKPLREGSFASIVEDATPDADARKEAEVVVPIAPLPTDPAAAGAPAQASETTMVTQTVLPVLDTESATAAANGTPLTAAPVEVAIAPSGHGKPEPKATALINPTAGPMATASAQDAVPVTTIATDAKTAVDQAAINAPGSTTDGAAPRGVGQYDTARIVSAPVTSATAPDRELTAETPATPLSRTASRPINEAMTDGPAPVQSPTTSTNDGRTATQISGALPSQQTSAPVMIADPAETMTPDAKAEIAAIGRDTSSPMRETQLVQQQLNTPADRALTQAQAIARQISVALTPGETGALEVRLDPPELGKVTMNLTIVDDRVSAAITAERPEIIDLLRRHSELLQRELQGAGHSDVDLQFDLSNLHGGDQSAFEAHASESTERSETGPTAKTGVIEISGLVLPAGRHLDIRL
ncbi:MAG: flagellar hook-length control protein FliK [Pseudomonadota bacterium]